MNPNRNKGSKAEIEALLLDAMGRGKGDLGPRHQGRRHHRLPHRRLARFVKPGQVLIQMGEEVDPERSVVGVRL